MISHQSAIVLWCKHLSTQVSIFLLIDAVQFYNAMLCMRCVIKDTLTTQNLKTKMGGTFSRSTILSQLFQWENRAMMYLLCKNMRKIQSDTYTLGSCNKNLKKIQDCYRTVYLMMTSLIKKTTRHNP